MLSTLAFPGFFPNLVSQSHNLYYHFQNQKSNLNSNSNSNPHHFPQTPLPSNPIQQPTPSMAQLASPPHSNANNLHFPHTLFSQIQNPNIFAWNFMFKAYSHSNSNSNTTASPQQCISLYNLMHHRFGLFSDRHSFPFLFKACARLSLSHKGQELRSFTFKLGLQHDVFAQNALLSMYSFCGLLHNARQVFDEIPLSICNVVSWNSMVSGCIQRRCYWDALKVFDEMLKCDVNARPNKVTLINALTACARIGILDMGRKIHGLLVRNEFDSQSYPILTEVLKQ